MKKHSPQRQSLTTLPAAPTDDRHDRLVRYSIAMAIRMICFVVACATPLVLPGWWFVIPAIGAVVLPYFAVIAANAGTSDATVVERPGAIIRVVPPGDRP